MLFFETTKRFFQTMQRFRYVEVSVMYIFTACSIVDSTVELPCRPSKKLGRAGRVLLPRLGIDRLHQHGNGI